MSASLVLGAMTAPQTCSRKTLSIRGCSCGACRARLLGIGLRPPPGGPLWTVEQYAAQLGISGEELLRIAGRSEIPR